MGSVGPQQQVPDRRDSTASAYGSGHYRTLTQGQDRSGHPTINAPDRSWHYQTSTASARSQWGLPDCNCKCEMAVGAVGATGPRPQAPDRSGQLTTGRQHTTHNITTNTQYTNTHHDKHNHRHTSTNTTTNTGAQTHKHRRDHKHTTTNTQTTNAMTNTQSQNTQPQTQPQSQTNNHKHKHTIAKTQPQTHNHKHTTANTTTMTNNRKHATTNTQSHHTTTTHSHGTQPQQFYYLCLWHFAGQVVTR